MALCPACGFDALDDEPWTGDAPSDEICPCCALHFGYDDVGRRTADFYAGWRGRWIVDGTPWFSSGRPAPSNGSTKRLTLARLAARDGSLIALFTDESGRTFSSTATVREHDGTRTASLDPDVFARWDGSADSIRAIVSAILAFADTQPT